MHGSLALAHLDRMVLQGVSISHEHLISVRMFSGARGIPSGRDIGSKDCVLVSRMNSLFNGSISGGANVMHVSIHKPESVLV